MADVTLNTGAFDDGPLRYARAADKALRTWAFEIERRAKMKSPVDTGFNKNSIYVVTPDGKMMANGRPVSQRPGDPNAPSSKGRKRYRPGQFAEIAPTESTGGYQALLKSISNSSGPNVQMFGGYTLAGPMSAAPDTLTCEVRVGAEYALYLEMGTITRRATPFLGPAAREVTPRLDNLLRRFLKDEGLL